MAHREFARQSGAALAGAVALAPLLVLAGPPMSGAEAKACADTSEASLSPEQSRRLLKAQGSFAGAAFSNCLSSTRSKPTNFTVIVEMSAAGTVQKSWLIGESAFAQCFREKMARSFVYEPSLVPFFTSFEYSSASK